MVGSVLGQQILGDCLIQDLVAFNFTPINPDANLIPTYCTNLYANGGNCVDLLAVNSTFNASLTFLTAAAQRADRMGRILQALLNKTLALAPSLPQNQTESGGGVDEPTFASPAARAAPNSTLRAINAAHYDAINRCLRDYFVITNGLWCFFTSTAPKAFLRTRDPTTPLSFAVDLARTGRPLSNCLPLVDTYCLLSFGVSVTFAQPPLGATFSLPDGSLSEEFCRGLAAAFNDTDDHASPALLALLVNNTVFTNRVPFIFQEPALEALERIYAGTFEGNWTDLVSKLDAAQTASRSLGLSAYTTGPGRKVAVDGWVAVPVPVLVFLSAWVLAMAFQAMALALASLTLLPL